MVMGVGDIIDFHFLSSLSRQSWPTFIQDEIVAAINTRADMVNSRNTNVDLCVILDNSERVTEQDFNLVKNAVRNLINSLGRMLVQLCRRPPLSLLLKYFYFNVYVITKFCLIVVQHLYIERF